jgi:hypothetical protein
MIRLNRNRGADVVPAGLRGLRRKEKEMKLLRHKAGGGKFDEEFWKSIQGYWKPAREELFQETEWKCAYCESLREKHSEGAVEHFRPKSKYWWLACCYDNYLFACGICNSEKGNAFPVDGTPMTGPSCLPGMGETEFEQLVGTCTPDPIGRGNGMTMKAFRAACQAEKPRLLDPYLVDPTPYFRWVAEEEMEASHGKWVAKPSGTIPPGKTRWIVKVAPRKNRQRTKLVFDAARDHYGLNRKSLQVLRGRVYAELSNLKLILQRINDIISQNINSTEINDVREITVSGLRNKMSAWSPYAGMARFFVYDEWNLLGR